DYFRRRNGSVRQSLYLGSRPGCGDDHTSRGYKHVLGVVKRSSFVCNIDREFEFYRHFLLGSLIGPVSRRYIYRYECKERHYLSICGALKAARIERTTLGKGLYRWPGSTQGLRRIHTNLSDPGGI